MCAFRPCPKPTGPAVDHAFRRWVRSLPCIVAVTARARGVPFDCLGRVEFCHLKHDGMGGHHAPPDIGNAWPGCAGHHFQYHQVSPSRFLKRHEIPDIGEFCIYLGRQYLGLDFAAPRYPDDWTALRRALLQMTA